jgi:predicted RNase H-like nuclease
MLAGVDGYKNGWIAAILQHDGCTEVREFPTFRSLQDSKSIKLIVIDIPIGLPDIGARACDQQARKVLGRSRGSSVFPSPIRAMLAARDWEHACRIRWEREGKRCSKQVAAILPKIREVDEAMTVDLQQRIREGHPELAFAMMNGGRPLAFKKKTKSGQSERFDLLVPYFPDIENHLIAIPRAKVDILDAYACLWTARRAVTNHSKTFPTYTIQDAMGLKMEIVA